MTASFAESGSNHAKEMPLERDVLEAKRSGKLHLAVSVLAVEIQFRLNPLMSKADLLD